MRRKLMLALAGTAIGFTSPAAASVVFTGTNGTNLSASATFDVLAGNVLQVVLTNTSLVDVNSNPDVLQALFFDVAGNPLLTYNDADLSAGSHLTGTFLSSGSDVGAEWAYKQNASGLGQGVSQDYGLSSAGYGIFGPGNTLSGVAGHADRGGSVTPPNGGDFGLVSAGYTPLGDSNGFTNQDPHTMNSVTFLLGGYTGSLSDISGIRFQYGTSTDETSLTGNRDPGALPEPGTWAMMLMGFGAIGFAMRRARKPGSVVQQIA